MGFFDELKEGLGIVEPNNGEEEELEEIEGMPVLDDDGSEPKPESKPEPKPEVKSKPKPEPEDEDDLTDEIVANLEDDLAKANAKTSELKQKLIAEVKARADAEAKISKLEAELAKKAGSESKPPKVFTSSDIPSLEEIQASQAELLETMKLLQGSLEAERRAIETRDAAEKAMRAHYDAAEELKGRLGL